MPVDDQDKGTPPVYSIDKDMLRGARVSHEDSLALLDFRSLPVFPQGSLITVITYALPED